MASRVLLIEDDDRLAELLTSYLGGRGYTVDRHATGQGGMAGLSPSVDMVLLDIMLPDADGFDLCRGIRGGQVHPQVPIIMLTARGDAMDRIVGLELGADDYLPKPFNPRELLARMKAVLRRHGAHGGGSAAAPQTVDVRRYGRLEVDLGRREVRLDDVPRRLTAHQFELLCALSGQQGRVMTREQLMHAVRNTAFDAFDRSIDVHISRIRAAIEDDPKSPLRIQTVRGAGYVFARHQD